MNPMRMQTLVELTENQAIRIKSPCPKWGVSGFGFKSLMGDLP